MNPERENRLMYGYIQDEFAVDGVLRSAFDAPVNRLAGHEISEADRQQTRKTEIGSVHVAPALEKY